MIKLNYNKVEEILTNIQTASSELKLKLPAANSGNSNLITISRINNLNTQINNIMERYKKLVSQNVNDTRLALDKLREADKELAAKIAKSLS
ncbi:DUF5344 family protein [Bacillus massilinigeriensis]|uniref:DUF5344 family protein n=1 Tax=Bacillus mediterraneensis TaxID=1805474 RepID=UPI0008F8F8FC|nr:DUF5344 family protein [Bacillus mediterraneensis]